MSDIFIPSLYYPVSDISWRAKSNLEKISLLITEKSRVSLISDSGSRLTELNRLLLPSCGVKR